MLRFEQTALSLTVAEDRLMGSQYHSINTYARLTSASDRLGNTIRYNFIGVNNLVPKTITVDKQLDTKLSIEQNDKGLITAIWDANGNKTSFAYSPFIDGSNAASGGTTTSGSMLATVTTSDGAVTHYTYDYPSGPGNDPLASEPDLTPHNPSDPGNTFWHADLSSITDPLGHTYAFGYAIDHSKLNYMANPAIYTGTYTQCGLPRSVAEITMPDNAGNSDCAVFRNNSQTWVYYDQSGVAKAGGVRNVVVTDATGFTRSYLFSDPVVIPLPQLGSLYNAQSFTDSKMICYQSTTIQYGNLGKETFLFDIGASMALGQIIDFSGNTTTFKHEEPWFDPTMVMVSNQLEPAYAAVVGTNTYSGVLSQNPVSFNGFYNDVTTQIDAVGNTKTFRYDVLDSGKEIPNGPRIMTDVTDELGRHTHYSIDSLQRRVRETVYASGNSNPVKITDFEYDGTFHGFMSKKIVRKVAGYAETIPGDSSSHGDPSWVNQDLVTQYVPDSNGRIKQEIADPGGLNLVTSYTYDSNGNKITSTDPRGNTTWFSYDSRNRLTAVVYADGSAKTYVYDVRGKKVTEYRRKQHRHLLSI